MKKILKYLTTSLLCIMTLISATLLIKNYYYRGLKPIWLFYPTLAPLFILAILWFSKKFLRAFLEITFLVFTLFCFYRFWHSPPPFRPEGITAHFQHYRFKIKNGKVYLSKPTGKEPPATGPFITCHYPLENLLDYLRFQPSLCVGYDPIGRIEFHLDQRTLHQFLLKEIRWVQFGIAGLTLLHEDYHQLQFQFTYGASPKSFPKYSLKEITKILLVVLEDSRAKVIESLTYDGRGQLIKFTETSLFNSEHENVFAEYNARGEIISRPRLGKTFLFPTKINLGKNTQLELKKYLP